MKKTNGFISVLKYIGLSFFIVSGFLILETVGGADGGDNSPQAFF